MALRPGICLLLSFLGGCTPPPAGLQIVRNQKLELPESAQGVLVGAGDIASCGSRSDDATGELVVDIVNFYQVREIPVQVFTAGDNAYPNGRTRDFRVCYDSAWGKLKNITRPAPGNHEYHTKEARPYFAYFSDSAGPSGKGSTTTASPDGTSTP